MTDLTPHICPRSGATHLKGIEDCPYCGPAASQATARTLSTCERCGAQHLAGAGNCPYCSGGTLPSQAPPQQAVEHPSSFREGLCATIGVVLLLVALNYLWLEPGNPGAGGTVNLHRLALGQTAGISAAIFLAAALRRSR